MMIKLKCLLIPLLFSTFAFSQAQFFFLSDFNNSYQKQNTYSAGILCEIPFNNPRWALDLQDNFGMTSAGNFYAHTSLITIGYIEGLQSGHPTHSHGGWGILVPLFLPVVGITYYPIDNINFRLGLYCNPLCYDYIALGSGQEISAAVIETGLKMIKNNKTRPDMFLSVGSNYSINIGSKLLLPEGYSDGEMLNVRLGVEFAKGEHSYHAPVRKYSTYRKKKYS